MGVLQLAQWAWTGLLLLTTVAVPRPADRSLPLEFCVHEVVEGRDRGCPNQIAQLGLPNAYDDGWMVRRPRP